MVYSKGRKMIAVEYTPLFGNVRPVLVVGEGCQMVKVASFSSAKKAAMFEEWLREFFGDMLVERPPE